MTTIHPQFITDATGNKISVILPIAEYQALIEELEDQDDVRLFDEALKNDNGERITLDEYLISREKSNE